MYLTSPNRLIPLLSVSCGLLTFSYIVLVVTTVFFASWQTTAVSSVRDNESKIATLEAQYYSTMNHINSLSPSSMGFVMPKDVQYVAETQSTAANLSFAGK
jgi:hypothetical protein